jgi:valyl-tRNA synthetase
VDIDFAAVFEKFGIPAAGGIAGWLGKAMTLARKVDALEKAQEAAAKTLLEASKEHAAALVAANKRCEVLEQRVAGFIAREEIERAIKELRQEIRRVEARLRNSTSEFAKDAELSKFMSEESDRWHKIERTLGQIEGTLKSMRLT